MGVTAGIIANPASGKDIRRLVAHASVFNNEEKANIVRRVLLALDAGGVERVLFMPDPYRLVAQALDGLTLRARVEPVEGRFLATAADTTLAAAAMEAAGARVIVSLGGDGTNRALAKGSTQVPLVAISTGTNNVFPQMVEGTVAGLAAAAVAAGAVDVERAAPRCKCIEVSVAGRPRDLALVDAVAMAGRFVGSRAIWEVEALREALLTRAHADAIGIAAVGGLVAPVAPDEDAGLHLVFTTNPATAVCRVLAPIAPGLLREVALARVERLPLGAIVAVTGPALVALDGERELTLRPGEQASLTVRRAGPPLVDVGRCLAEARAAGFLRR